jgi:hypothetical membrane protein
MTRVRITGALWALEILFFVAHAVAQAAWTVPFDPMGYAISDLGAVSCFTEPGAGREICSPAHVVMNLGLIVTGLLMAAGALVFPLSGRRPRLDRLSRVLLVIGGLGCAGVGFAPEDVALGPHTVSAIAAMVVGNIGLTLFGFALRPDRAVLGSVAATFAIVGLGGVTWLILLLVTGSPMRYEVGGLAERIAAFSLIAGQVAVGIAVFVPATRRNRRAVGG